MNKLANAFAKAGLCTDQDAAVAGLSLKELTALRNETIVASIAAQGKTYKHSPSGSFRPITKEQAELLAINTAIRKARK